MVRRLTLTTLLVWTAVVGAAVGVGRRRNPMLAMILSKLRTTEPQTPAEVDNMRALTAIIGRALDANEVYGQRLPSARDQALRLELAAMEARWAGRFGRPLRPTPAVTRPRPVVPQVRPSSNALSNRLQHSLFLLQNVVQLRRQNGF